MADYGNRVDGTAKGLGFFGEIPAPDGNVSTELSMGVQIAGKETEIPLLVPTMTREEINYLVNGGKVTDAIAQKAVDFAMTRMQSGKPVFAVPGEQMQLPKSAQEQFDSGFNKVMGKGTLSNINGAMPARKSGAAQPIGTQLIGGARG